MPRHTHHDGTHVVGQRSRRRSENRPTGQFLRGGVKGTGGGLPRNDVLDRFKDRDRFHALVERANRSKLGGASALDIRCALNAPWPAFDQRRRGTCTAFAAAACAELVGARETGQLERLSPEFLYWHMVTSHALPEDEAPPLADLGATKLSQARDALACEGICADALVPYQKDSVFSDTLRIAKDSADDLDLSDVEKLARNNRFRAAIYWDILDDSPDRPLAEIVYEELASGRAVAMGIPIFALADDAYDNWTCPQTMSSGIVWGPNDRPKMVDRAAVVSGHVACIVGFEPDPSQGGGGWFIFKNSWNSRFGKHPSSGIDPLPHISDPGFGALTAAHVSVCAHEILSIKR